MLTKLFYHLSYIYFPKVKWLWLCLLGCIAFTFISGVFLDIVGGNIFLEYASTMIFFTSFPIFWLIPCVKTFFRLENERGVYKNHRLQEVIYTLWYTIILLVVVFGYLFITYDFIKSFT